VAIRFLKGLVAMLAFGWMFGLFLLLAAGGAMLISSGYVLPGLFCLTLLGLWMYIGRGADWDRRKML
jgi:hypothetical protein